MRPYDKFKDEPFLGPITRRGCVWLGILAAHVALYALVLALALSLLG